MEKPNLQNEHHGTETVIFMHDGAPPHKELLTDVFQIRVLNKHFAKNIIA